MSSASLFISSLSALNCCTLFSRVVSKYFNCCFIFKYIFTLLYVSEVLLKLSPEILSLFIILNATSLVGALLRSSSICSEFGILGRGGKLFFLLKDSKGSKDGEKKSKTPKAEKTPAKKTKRDESDTEEPVPKRAKTEAKPVMNKTDTDLNAIDFGCKNLSASGKKYNLKISSWNVSGIRALLKKNGLDYIMKEDADIVALQETKCNTDKLPPEVKLKNYHYYFLDSKKPGYCGLALYTKEKPIDIKYGLDNSEFDDDGRLITAEYPNFYLVNVYVPNSGQKLVTLPKRLKWNETFKAYIKELDEKKPVIICGDMNVAHQEIDLTNPKTNTKNAGFTKEEREDMTDFLETGFVDTFRALYPDKTGAYTFWSYFANARSKNIGWRLDYFLVSERIKDDVCDNVMRDKVYGSDHCPIVLYVHI